MVGSFAAGLVYALLPPTAVQYKALIMTGFLGGLTTLSAFSLEVVLQLQDGKFFQALAHWLICACVCLVLCYLGIRLGLRLLP
jgi:CrcB protein